MAHLVTFAVHYIDEKGKENVHPGSGCSFDKASGIARSLALAGTKVFVNRITICDYSNHVAERNRTGLQAKWCGIKL